MPGSAYTAVPWQCGTDLGSESMMIFWG